MQNFRHFLRSNSASASGSGCRLQPAARPRDGYILLMVMVLLIVMATVLTTIATRSLQTSQEAIVSATQFQQRVGIASCQAAFLPNANSIFNKLDDLERTSRSRRREPRHIIAESVILGDQRFDLVLADENAKVNLNTMYHKIGKAKTNQQLRSQLSINEFRALRLTPAVGANVDNSARSKASESKSKAKSGSNAQTSDSDLLAATPVESAILPAFRSWGEVFAFERLAEQTPAKQMRLDFTNSMTLWGSGQVNINHASEQTVRTVAELVISPPEAKKLVGKMMKSDSVDIQTTLELETIKPSEKKALSSLLGKYSYAYSLFVDVVTLQGRSRKLFVESVDINGAPQLSEFVFH